MRAAWLAERGYDNSYYTTFRMPDSNGLRCIGRWPWGPSWELCGRDTFLYLGSGSGVRILSIADSTTPRMLGQINARGLINQLVVQDTLLFVACGSWGAQVYSVADPANPQELGSMDAVIGDLTVQDTLCYCLGGDTFRIYNVADPGQPEQLGAVRDSGEVIAVTNGHAFCGGRWVMNAWNVTNPAAPQWVNSGPGECLDMQADQNKLYFMAAPNYLAILNVSDPQSIGEFGRMTVDALRVFADSGYAYLGDHDGFIIADVSDSTNPNELGRTDVDGWQFDAFVFAPQTYAYVASGWGGLAIFDIHDAAHPEPDSTWFPADVSRDVYLDSGVMYVANDNSGLQVVDAGMPGQLVTLSTYDVVGSSPDLRAVCAGDSFAYIGWRMPRFHSVDVSDPANPLPGGFASITNPPEDMVLRDSFVYVAEANRFQVVNVARPREPELVGSCITQDGVYFGLEVQDTFAYLMSGRLQVINIARPDAPVIVSSTSLGGAAGLAVRDTFAYIPNGWDSVRVYSVADPATPRLLSSAPCGVWPWDAAVGESTLFVATSDGWGVDVYNISDPGQPVRTGTAPAATDIRRLHYADGLLYAAMWDAGVAVYETTQTGVSEPGGAPPSQTLLRAWPNPTARWCLLMAPRTRPSVVVVRDAAGREMPVPTEDSHGAVALDLVRLPSGVYFAEVTSVKRRELVKILKR
jgi:hypothetical protein